MPVRRIPLEKSLPALRLLSEDILTSSKYRKCDPGYKVPVATGAGLYFVEFYVLLRAANQRQTVPNK